MSEAAEKVIDLIYGRWRSQILYVVWSSVSSITSLRIVRDKPMLWRRKLALMRSFFIG